MAKSAGRTVALSAARRRMVDYMRLAQSVPQIFIHRTMSLADVADARRGSHPKIGWSACFIKAYALAGQTVPAVRQSFLTVPHPRLFEHETSSATVAVERAVDGEPVVFGLRISQPERRPLSEIHARLSAAAHDPLETVEAFQRQIRYGRWPGFLRRMLMWYALNFKGTLRDRHFGTFAVTSVHGSGAELISPRAPLTTIFTYGPVSSQGDVTVRLGFDHRVLDGMTAGRVLAEMEQALLGPIRIELAGAAR